MELPRRRHLDPVTTTSSSVRRTTPTTSTTTSAPTRGCLHLLRPGQLPRAAGAATLQPERTPGSIPADYKYSNLALFAGHLVCQQQPDPDHGRADRADTSPAPTYNAAASTFFGRDNSEVLSNKFLIQPRFGFNYTFDSERPTQLRGGIGLFQGDAPQVWLSNSYSATGFNNSVYTYTAYNPALQFTGTRTASRSRPPRARTVRTSTSSAATSRCRRGQPGLRP